MLIFDQVSEFLKTQPLGVIEILGPTASGKTSFSVELAHFLQKHFPQTVEIISVDSRQIYRECDISAAKITTEEMQGIMHHGLDLVDLAEEYNAVKFQKYAFETIKAIQARGNIPLLCGGTMLWLDAVSENYIFSDTKIDSTSFEKSKQTAQPRWPVLKIGLHWDRKQLYERINQRAVIQFESGLINETKHVLNKYPDITKNAYTSFGYREIQDYLEGRTTYAEALRINQQRNRKYAKRQLTWWRGREDVVWIDGQTRSLVEPATRAI